MTPPVIKILYTEVKGVLHMSHMSKKIDFDKLRRSSMLGKLNQKQWDDFKMVSSEYGRRYQKGQIIHLEDDPCVSADFIVAGALHVKRHDVEGRTFMIERFKEGDLIGANLLFSSDPVYPMTIIAESDCIIVSYGKEQILHWCQSNAEFLESYMLEISDKTKVLVNAVRKISTGTLRENLTVYFNELMERTKNDSSGRVVKLPVTKKELAERYGVARTSLSRELARMESDGIIIVMKDNKIKII